MAERACARARDAVEVEFLSREEANTQLRLLSATPPIAAKQWASMCECGVSPAPGYSTRTCVKEGQRSSVRGETTLGEKDSLDIDIWIFSWIYG